MVDTQRDIGSFDDGRDGIASCQPQGLDALLRDGRDHVGTAGELYGHFAIYRAILNFCNLSVKNIASAQLTRSKVFRDHDRTSLEDRIRKFSLLQAQRIRAANGNDCHDFLATFERQVDLCIDSPPRNFCDGPASALRALIFTKISPSDSDRCYRI